MEKKLIISPRRFKGDSSVVSVRLPNDLVKSLDEIAGKTGRTRNEIIQKCIEFSVENLEVK
jgi:predicted DNA-binding protein